MSLRDVHGGRALVLRLVLAELVAKRGEGPLAPRHVLLARGAARFDALFARGVAGSRAPLEPGAYQDLRASKREPT